ncbi:MAG: acetylglutamate kinase, partial [Bacteroidales bacterium]|nr:acetylglutamate kinase [Bacteroidales bacterium]
MTTVVKIGGAIIEDKAALDAFCRDFNLLRGRKLLVHGGGPMA